MKALPRLFWFFFFARYALSLAFRSEPKTATFIIAAISFAFAFWSVGLFTYSKRISVKSLAAGPVAAYLGLAAISLLWTKADGISAVGYLGMMACDVITVSLCSRLIEPEEHIRIALSGIIYSALFIGFVAIFLSPGAADSRIGDEVFLHPNFIGKVCAIALIACAYLWTQEDRRKWLVLGSLVAVVLLLSASKTSILSASVALLFMLRNRMSISKAVAAVCIAAVLYVASSGHVRAYIEESNAQQSSTLAGRAIMWVALIEPISTSPVLGNGYASFRKVVPDLFDDWEPQTAHNEILQQITTLGIVGLFFAFRIYKAIFDSRFAPWGQLILALLIFFVIHGLTEADSYQTNIPLAFCILLSSQSNN